MTVTVLPPTVPTGTKHQGAPKRVRPWSPPNPS